MDISNEKTPTCHSGFEALQTNDIMWRCSCVQKRSRFHQEDHLISLIFDSTANKHWINSIFRNTGCYSKGHYYNCETILSKLIYLWSISSSHLHVCRCSHHLQYWLAFCTYYRAQTKLWEGNVFTGVCLSVHKGSSCYHYSWCIGSHCTVPWPWSQSPTSGHQLWDLPRH